MENQNNTNEDNTQQSKHNWIRLLIILFIVITVIWLGAGICANIMEDKLGSFTDIFNAINALFSGLAAAGMVITLLMQKEELGQQRQATKDGTTAQQKQTDVLNNLVHETKESANALILQKDEAERLRKEMEAQKNILAETLKQTNISRLEDLIYKTIDQHNNVINNLSGEIKGQKYEKTEFLEKWAEIHIIKEESSVDYTDCHYLRIGTEREEIIMVPNISFLYLAMSKCINVILPIIKHIDEVSILNDDNAGKEFDNRHKYYSWIMGSISYSELYLLKEYYWNNALYSDFKRISEKYGLLEGIRLHEGKSQDNDPAYYPEKAKEKYVNARASLIQ